MSLVVLATSLTVGGCVAADPPSGKVASLPAAFPLDVPLLTGSILERATPRDSVDGPWTVVVRFSSLSAEDARDAIVAELKAAGYHLTSDRSTTEALVAELDNGVYVVDVTIATGEPRATTASYLVGPAPAVD